MLNIATNGNICARCAVRRRILAFQQNRRRANERIAFASIRRYTTEARENPFLRKQTHSGNFERVSGRSTSPRLSSRPLKVNQGSAADHTSSSGKPREQPSIRFSDGSVIRPRGPEFQELLWQRLDVLKKELREAPVLEEIVKDVPNTQEKELGFKKLWAHFTKKILKSQVDYTEAEDDGKQRKTLWGDLKIAYEGKGANGLDDRIKFAFYGHTNDSRFTQSEINNQKALADLRYPSEWFPATRAMHRTIHVHVGPTNSGKTYHALQRLEQSKNGVYAGPLRLLAHEVYTRLNAKGKACSLITGEERRAAENKDGDSYMSACTVEMVPLNKTLDVAVIDEIQMIGDEDRGWAWTQALLGVKAREVHVCGEERTVPIIRELCASINDEVVIHRYTRLSPLEMAESSLNGKLKGLRKGDCVVSFSVMGIHALRREIERYTGRKVAIVYGSLPPETRAQQARLFNDPDNDYDFLVASDAVGMGLNLAIKRIIFETASKFDGIRRRTLDVASIKQIGGRAGRFRIAEQATEAPASEQDLAAAKGDQKASRRDDESVGIVTTLEPFDFPIVSAAMASDPEPIQTAGIFPPAPVLERFASYFPPRTPFSYIVTRLHDISMMHSRFHLCSLKDHTWVADLIEPVDGLTVTDRSLFCQMPCSKSDNDLWKELLPAFARIVANQTGGDLVDIQELPLEILETEVGSSREALRAMERLHKGIVAYLWLSYRFPGVFNTRPLAFHVKGLVEDKIEQMLGKFSFSELRRRRLAERQRAKEVIDNLISSSADEAPGTAQPGQVTDKSDNVSDDTIMDILLRHGKTTRPEINTSGEDQESQRNVAGAGIEQASPESLPEEKSSYVADGEGFGGEGELYLEEPDVEEALKEKTDVGLSSSTDAIEDQSSETGPRAEGKTAEVTG